MAFYMVNGNKIQRLRTYEDGIEVIPPECLTPWGAMIKGISQGKENVKRQGKNL